MSWFLEEASYDMFPGVNWYEGWLPTVTWTQMVWNLSPCHIGLLGTPEQCQNNYQSSRPFVFSISGTKILNCYNSILQAGPSQEMGTKIWTGISVLPEETSMTHYLWGIGISEEWSFLRLWVWSTWYTLDSSRSFANLGNITNKQGPRALRVKYILSYKT